MGKAVLLQRKRDVARKRGAPEVLRFTLSRGSPLQVLSARNVTLNEKQYRMIDKAKVQALVEQWLQGKDYFLTDLTVTPDDCITVEIDQAEGVWIEDCVQLSRFIEDHLSRDEEDYELEVGSAGLGQPFKVLRQWQNHVGKQVEVITTDGRKLKGTLQAADAEHVTLAVRQKVQVEGKKRPVMQDVDITLPMSEVKSGRYLLDFK